MEREGEFIPRRTEMGRRVMITVGGGERPLGSLAPESDKSVCRGAQGWTLYCPSLPALTGTRRAGEVEKRFLGAPESRGREELQERSESLGKVKYSRVPARSPWTSEAHLSEPQFS